MTTYDITKNWNTVVNLMERAKKSGKYATIATNGSDGFPNIAPVGFIFATQTGRILYFEEFATQTGKNIEADHRVVIQLVDSAPVFWAGFLFSGRFKVPPGMRLKGTAGKRRKATSEEINMLNKRLGILAKTKGAQKIWKGLEYVRDIEINEIRPVHYPGVTENLWKS